MRNTIESLLWNNFTIGDNELSFNEVYIAYSAALFEHSFRITKDSEASSEIVDFLLMKISKVRNSYKSDSDFRKFLFKSCANRSVDYLRTEKRRQIGLNEVVRSGNYVSGSIEDLMVMRDQYNEAMLALKALPEGMKAVFIHSYINERSPKEIAALLKVPETSVYSQKYQAIKRLRSTLSRH